MVRVRAVRSIIAFGLSIMLVVGACARSTQRAEEPPLKPCAVVYPVARCQAMTDLVAADLGKNRDDVVSVAIVPDAPPGGVHLSGGWHIRVRLALTDGTTFDKLICGGVLHEAACTDETRLTLRLAVDDDVARAAPRALATPIAVPAMSIPIDRRGAYEIPLGDGSEPDGFWSSGTLQFAVPWPEDVALRDATVTLDLRTGATPTEPSLVFDVLWFRRGATLEVRDLVVR